MEPPLLRVGEVAAALSASEFRDMECLADLELDAERLTFSVSVHVVDLERVEFREALEALLREAQVRAFANHYGIPEEQLKKFLSARWVR